MKIITHGDIDGFACAALYMLNQNNGKWMDVEYHLPSDTFDPRGAIILDLGCDRNNRKKAIHYLNNCRIWIDHHPGWNLEHDRLVYEEKDSCAEVLWEYYNCDIGYDLVEIAKQCDTGYPTLGDAIIYHKTIKTDFVSRAMKDMIVASMMGMLPHDFLLPYVRLYDDEIIQETNRLYDLSEKVGNVRFVNAHTRQIYDKNKLLSMLYEDSLYGVVISRKDGEHRTTIATGDTNTNLLDLFNLDSGSSSRITMKGNKLIEVIQKVN